ncbi:MAG: ribulose-phosphate 3-epimerase [Meiothermus sp.]|nr:ribulose-phosphate 3-epimerase [Meiothermus sp.]
MPQIAPSILAADFTRLGEQVLACAEAGADLIHVDVMDGRFVPNLSMGLVVVEALHRVSPLPLDVHLMILEPERYIADFVQAGAHYLTFHPEATPHTHRVLQQIKELGIKAGMALNPGTPLEYFEPLLGDLDLALLMTVNPGFGGQKFIGRSLERLKRLKEMRDQLNPGCLLEVDGGINRQTAPQAVALGADILVAGSAVFEGDVHENIAALRESYAFAG